MPTKTIKQPQSLNKTYAETEGQVTVHCRVVNKSSEIMGVRVWNTAVLADADSKHESALIYVYGLLPFPQWTAVSGGNTLRFTLIFTRLPVTCAKFHLLEHIAQSGGFEVNNIMRNETDVYNITL